MTETGQEPMYETDALITQTVNLLAGSNHLLDSSMIWASRIGVELLVLCVAAQWWVTQGRSHTRYVLVSTGFSFLLGLALNQVILLFVHRMRPYDAGLTHLLIAPSADYSFPSDHATACFAIAASFLLHRFYRRGSGFLVAALLISFSRIFIGTHYASDVFGGAITGIMAAVLVRFAFREDSRLNRTLISIW